MCRTRVRSIPADRIRGAVASSRIKVTLPHPTSRMAAASNSNIVTWAELMTGPLVPISPEVTAYIASKDVVRVTLAAAWSPVPGSASPLAEWRLHLRVPLTESSSVVVELRPELKAGQDGNNIVFFRVELWENLGGARMETVTFGTMLEDGEDGQGFPTVQVLVKCLIAQGLHRFPVWPGPLDGFFPWCLGALVALSRADYLGEHAVTFAKRKRSSLEVKLPAGSTIGQ
ncbi:hypothetical protein CALVIDRAFT_68305 [Calocera viscosa TUFC12733]|uniref:Uncharacterized protein n=1 Tax=Calocera viscosa (strain TUFC12733) TaxID=1330018 RepID=A0A167N8S8_CALVF|nr:hypothetical protein CALVIDRAFT_68305 [Calocera viscosa TUFC12733]